MTVRRGLTHARPHVLEHGVEAVSRQVICRRGQAQRVEDSGRFPPPKVRREHPVDHMRVAGSDTCRPLQRVDLTGDFLPARHTRERLAGQPVHAGMVSPSGARTSPPAAAAQAAPDPFREGRILVMVPTLDLLMQTAPAWRSVGHRGPMVAVWCWKATRSSSSSGCGPRRTR